MYYGVDKCDKHPTYPYRHCCKRFTFTAKIQILDNNGNQDCEDAYANKEHEILNCNIHRKHKRVTCFVDIIFALNTYYFVYIVSAYVATS